MAKLKNKSKPKNTQEMHRRIITVDFSDLPAIVMQLCYAAKRGDRGAARTRERWNRRSIEGKLIKDFDEKKLRLGRGQPKGFVHKRLSERNEFIISHVEDVQCHLAELGYVNTLSRACWHVDHYFNKTGPYRNRAGDVHYDEKGARFTFEKIRNIVRRYNTRRNKLGRAAK
jgi:hypothetical protein